MLPQKVDITPLPLPQHKLFAPIRKVDAERREVWGVLVAEETDRSGEIFDYAASKKHFVSWSDEISKASDGKSVGNLRSMHGSIAAGKFISMEYDDDAKKIDVGAKVVDDQEWAKVVEGVYTGFSIGGDYVRRWTDPTTKLKRYEASPVEGSLVDFPCVPSATFELYRASGQAPELVKFKMVAEMESAATPYEAAAVIKKYTGFTVLPESLKRDEPPIIDPPADPKAEKTASPAFNIRTLNGDANIDTAKQAGVRKLKISDLLKTKNKESVKMPASQRIVKVIGQHLRAMKRLEIPETLAIMIKALYEPDLAKGMYAVSQLAGMIETLSYLVSSAEYEAIREGDGSGVPGDLKDAMEDLCSVLVEMAEEECDELLAEEKSGMISLAAKTGAVLKVIGVEGAKTEPAKVIEIAKAAEPEKLEKKFGKASKEAVGGMRKMHKSMDDGISSLEQEIEDADEGEDDEEYEKLAGGDLVLQKRHATKVKDAVAKVRKCMDKMAEHLDHFDGGASKAAKAKDDKAKDDKSKDDKDGKDDEADDDAKKMAASAVGLAKAARSGVNAMEKKVDALVAEVEVLKASNADLVTAHDAMLSWIELSSSPEKAASVQAAARSSAGVVIKKEGDGAGSVPTEAKKGDPDRNPDVRKSAIDAMKQAQTPDKVILIRE